MKVCSKCLIEKPLTEFHKQKGGKDGRRPDCKICRVASSQQYRINSAERKNTYRRENKDKLKENRKKYYIQNRERDKARQKEYYAQHKEQYIQRAKEWVKNNPDKMKKIKQEYRCKNRDKLNKYARDYAKTYIPKKKEEDPAFRLRLNIRGRLHAFFKNGKRKPTSMTSVLGCTWQELRDYIEQQFVPGMSWETYGPKGWHIDHIKPLSSFDLADPEQFKQANHYTNLQPLWAEDNYKKGATV